VTRLPEKTTSGSTKSSDQASASNAGANDRRTIVALEGRGAELASRLPDIVLDAVRISSTIAHGIHGRRRAGPGETFWQFRQFETNDSATLIDWRRSAGSDHLFVREREWEAAHTVWLWPDLSPSMEFNSHLSTVTKRDRALLLTFALGELLVHAGERIGLMGVTLPSASRKTTLRMAETLAAQARVALVTMSLPPVQRMSRFASAVWVSDFLDPIPPLAARIEELAQQGVTGHLIQVLDPAEETLAYSGRTEFVGMEGGYRWIADRAESLTDAYRARLLAHRDELDRLCRRLGWSLTIHHTDRAPTEPLLALIMRLRGEPVAAKPRSSSNAASGGA
jgi:uncharacterized protein (DUF58 family)